MTRPRNCLVFKAVLHAPAAGAERHACGQDGLGFAVLSHLCECVNDAANEADKDGGNTAESDRRIEEDQSTESNGKLVQSSYHGVCGRGCDTDGPGRGV